VTEPPNRLSSWIAGTGPDDQAALVALRETIERADDAGTVERGRYPAHVVPSVPRLRAAGLVELLDATSPSGMDGDGWALARLTPPVLADLLEQKIEAGRESLLEEIDRRLDAIERSARFGENTAAPAATPDLESPESESSLLARYAPEGGEPHSSDAASGDPEAEFETSGTSVATGGIATTGSTLASRGLVKVYRKRRVVNEVDLYLRQGEIVGLLGPNGAGKTTTFYMVVGLIRPDRGKVYLGDDDVTGVPMYRRARRGIGYLAQEPSVFRKLTVEENVLAVLQMMGLSRKVQRARLEVLLDELGIKHLRHTKAYALSGGERRRLEITRALVGDPKFMLLDEPFAGVDPIAVHDIQQIVSDLRRREIGVLISDHNVEQTLDIVDRAYIMYDGRVRVSGTVSELVWNDEVAEIYLGPTLTARMRQRYAPPTEEAG